MVIKSLITNDLFFSERVFKNANLMKLHFNTRSEDIVKDSLCMFIAL